MKKFSAFAVLIICLFSSTSYAWVNVAVTAAELAAPFVMRNGVKWLLPSSATANIPTRGFANGYNVGRYSIGGYGGKFMTGALTAATLALMEYVRNHKSEYPSLADGLDRSTETFPAYSDFTGWNTDSGDIVKGKDGRYYKLGAKEHEGNDNCSPSSEVGSRVVYGRLEIAVPNGKNSGCGADVNVATQKWTYEVVNEPPVRPATVAEYSESLSPDPASEAVTESVSNDIDKLINDAPNLFSSPDQAVKQNSDEANAAPPSLPSPDPEPQPNPIPTNPNAPPATDESTEDNPETPDVDETEETIVFNGPQIPDFESINLSPLLSVGQALSGKFPFSLAVTCQAMASSFMSAPVAPSFTITFPSPFNYTWTMSLSQWDSWAATLRYIIAASFMVLISMSILRKWS